MLKLIKENKFVIILSAILFVLIGLAVLYSLRTDIKDVAQIENIIRLQTEVEQLHKEIASRERTIDSLNNTIVEQDSVIARSKREIIKIPIKYVVQKDKIIAADIDSNAKYVSNKLNRKHN